MRIVTLLPSATDWILALGLEKYLVGVSHSCPVPRPDIPRVTSTRVPISAGSAEIDAFVREHLVENEALYDLDMDALARLKPDVIVSQALCDVCAVATGDVESAVCGLDSRPVLVDLNPNTLADVLDDLLRVGAACNATALATRLRAGYEARLERVREAVAGRDRPTVAFLEWLDPPFNGGHWNPEIIEIGGGRELLGDPGSPSSTISWDAVVEAKPDVLLVACCGLGVQRTRDDVHLMKQWIARLSAWEAGRTFVADGDRYFARPGPDLVTAAERVAKTLHPDVNLGSELEIRPFERA